MSHSTGLREHMLDGSKKSIDSSGFIPLLKSLGLVLLEEHGIKPSKRYLAKGLGQLVYEIDFTCKTPLPLCPLFMFLYQLPKHVIGYSFNLGLLSLLNCLSPTDKRGLCVPKPA